MVAATSIPEVTVSLLKSHIILYYLYNVQMMISQYSFQLFQFRSSVLTNLNNAKREDAEATRRIQFQMTAPVPLSLLNQRQPNQDAVAVALRKTKIFLNNN
jgi:hypothetical protein